MRPKPGQAESRPELQLPQSEQVAREAPPNGIAIKLRAPTHAAQGQHLFRRVYQDAAGTSAMAPYLAALALKGLLDSTREILQVHAKIISFPAYSTIEIDKRYEGST
jgi:hypothetical protein